MIVWLILYSTIFILEILVKTRVIKKKTEFYILAIILIFMVGLRNENMGQNDTVMVYKPFFERIAYNDFSYILGLKDIGFQFLTFIFTRLFGDNFEFYIFLLGIPYIVAICFFIYKYSRYTLFSMVMFVSLQYFEISFTLLRQVNAMAFIILATHYIIKKETKKSIFLVSIACLFHLICIPFFIIILFRNFTIKKHHLIWILMLILIFVIGQEFIIRIVFKLLGSNSRFAIYSQKGHKKNYTFYILNFILWLGCIFSYNFKTYDRTRNLLLMMSSVAVILSPLVTVLGEVSRVVYLFGISELVLFPDVFSRFEIKSRLFLTLVGICILMLYFLFILGPGSGVVPYISRWSVSG